ncbi:response regulator [Sneathiella chungangensis]|uniref:Response regulator n=1 Tax=Sneathiella chungangensis TaxID=1418234 RepID=A0A845MC90_9PROT|nr:response regulator transcription factor [Sneathiella chungangensis]MZR20714.1 response regulator [Sneathiella chungangensis]
MKTLIYILEDNRDVAAVFERELTHQGFDVAAAHTISGFSDLLAERLPDLCILDLTLPDGDGLNVLQQTLKGHSIPAIIVSGRGTLSDKIRGLDLGADDYLVKPVDALELAARVRSMLRRRASAARAADDSPVFHFAGWTVDFSTYVLTSPDNAEETMSAADASLLKAFVESPGKVLTRDALLDRCQIVAADVFDRSIDTRISRLRKKLNDDSKNPSMIRTIYGAGYVFTPKVTHDSP